MRRFTVAIFVFRAPGLDPNYKDGEDIIFSLVLVTILWEKTDLQINYSNPTPMELGATDRGQEPQHSGSDYLH